MGCNSTLTFISAPYWKYTFGVSMCVISVLGSIENAIVLMVLGKYKCLRTSTNKILASLAVADFLSSLIVAPLHALQLLQEDLINNCILDTFRIYSSPILIGASAYIIGFVSYDRCLHFRRLQNYKMSDKKFYGVMIICWSIAIVVPMVRLFDSIEAKKVYSVLVITNAILILLTLIISYAGLLVMLKLHQGASDSNAANSRRIENERRAVKTVVLIVSFYVLMLVPLLIYHGLYSMKNVNRQLLVKSYVIGMMLAVGNSVVNPLIYCYRTPSLKKHIKRFLRITAPRKNSRSRQDSLISETNS